MLLFTEEELGKIIELTEDIFTTEGWVEAIQHLANERIEIINTARKRYEEQDTSAKILNRIEDHICSKQMFSSGCDGHEMWIWSRPLLELIEDLRKGDKK